MTPQEQNKAIAEYCGWKNLHIHEGKLFGTIPDAEYLDSQGALDNYFIVPDYHSDLNAIHEAENYMMKIDPELYKQVYLRTYMDCYFNGGVSAPPQQRCEAFLRTIGKWKD